MSKPQKIIVSFVAVVIIVGAVMGLYIAYASKTEQGSPLVYAPKQMLLELWNDYKNSNIEAGSNRTLDKEQDNVSTSEGQSYTMLRSVWVDDKKTFDESWQWTKDNLQRDDYLLSWKFGKLPDGNYGIQNSIGGQNTASDGDSDVALSLLMAYSRWKEDKYLYDALPIITSMWEKEVVMIQSKPVLVANDLERNNPQKVIVNPSYLSPYAYKIFANVDKNHDWKGLADNSYSILTQASKDKLDANTSAGLPPDWITIDRVTGAMSAPENGSLTTKFSYDAIRVPWRMALDWQWFKDPRAKEVLATYSHLKDEWNANQKIVSTYAHGGSRLVDYDSPAVYGATLGYFNVMEPQLEAEIYKTKLSVLYSPDEQKYAKGLGYYDENWTWFGMALSLNELPNLTDVGTYNP